MSRPRARFCINGHDTDICGRYLSSECKQCSRDRVARKLERTHCVHGHDTRIYGRHPTSHRCKECVRLQNVRVAEQRRKAKPFNEPTVPFAPLEQRLERAGFKLHDIVNGDRTRRYRKWGIPVEAADHICITRLGLHPIEVWGFAFFLAEKPHQREMESA